MNVKADRFFKYALCALLIIPLLGCVENRLAAIDAQTGEPIANAMVLSSKNPKLFPAVDSNFIGLTDTNGQMRDFSMFSENFIVVCEGYYPGLQCAVYDSRYLKKLNLKREDIFVTTKRSLPGGGSVIETFVKPEHRELVDRLEHTYALERLGKEKLETDKRKICWKMPRKERLERYLATLRSEISNTADGNDKKKLSAGIRSIELFLERLN